MLYNFIKRGVFIGVICAMPVCSVTATEADLVAALQNTYSACVGINGKLETLKKMAGINTAITGVGAGLGAGATVAGIVKSSTDAEIDDLLKKLAEAEARYGAPTIKDPDTFIQDFAQGSPTGPSASDQAQLTALQQKSKK